MRNETKTTALKINLALRKDKLRESVEALL